MVRIYALIDPITGATRYVGKTIQPLGNRLSTHVGKCERVAYRSARWIRSLKDQGLRPEIVLLEEADESNWRERERHWINFYRSRGADLTNHTDGGDGLQGWRQSDDHRHKLGLANRGSSNGGAKLSDAMAQQIKILTSQGVMKHQEIADVYGVSKYTVRAISQNQRWSHIPRIDYTGKANGENVDDSHFALGL